MQAGGNSSRWGEWAMPGQESQSYTPPPAAPASAAPTREREAPPVSRPRRVAARIIDKAVLLLGVLAAATLADEPVGVWDAATGTGMLRLAAVVATVYFVVLLKGFGRTLGSACLGASSDGRDTRLAVAGVAIALVPVAVMAAPGGAALVQTDEQQVAQLGWQFVKDVTARDYRSACEVMSADQRAAIVARGTNSVVHSATVDDCAAHAIYYGVDIAGGYREHSDRGFPVRITDFGATAGPKVETGPLLTFVKENGEWKVDALAAERKSFGETCSLVFGDSSAAKGGCGCMWHEVRAAGTVGWFEYVNINVRQRLGELPASVSSAGPRCMQG